MNNSSTEKTLFFSIFGKDRITGERTLTIRKEQDVMASLQKDIQSQRVARLREAMHLYQPASDILLARKEQLLQICPGYHFTRKDGKVQAKRYNGIVAVVVGGCFSEREAVKIKKSLALLPQTRAAFIGYDMKSVIVLFRFFLPGHVLPAGAESIRQFHATAIRIAVQYIRPYLPFHMEMPEDTVPEMTFYQTVDKSLYYNPQAQPIYIRLKSELPGAITDKDNDIRTGMLNLHAFMQRNYDIRFNILTDMPEYRRRNEKKDVFIPLDQREMNSISLDALEEGLHVWDRDTRRYVLSNRTPRYNPVEDFLKHTGKWDRRLHIQRLAECVKCNNRYWPLLFRRWFLSMVATWQRRNHQYANCTSPVLVGEQGYRKSTFCRLLLPPELRFGFTDRLDIGNKRTAEMFLNRFLLINLDEFDQIGDKQQGFLKHLLQKPSAAIRKAYSSVIVETRRYASFIGTSNMQSLLYDTSGSRRFICIRVKEKIDFPTDMDYRQLYAEAVHALNKGERYWLDEQEEALLKESNREFEVENKYAQLFWSRYRQPEHNGEGNYLYCTEILQSLCTSSEFSKMGNGTMVQFGRLLQRWGFVRKHGNGGSLYHVVKRG